jgi:protein-L-isoaspartate O-methyltransferase
LGVLLNIFGRVFRGDEKRISRLHTGTGVLCVDPPQLAMALITTLSRVLFGHLIEQPWLVRSSLPAIEERAKNARVFEYGAGMSTPWFTTRAREVISVESNAKWAERINQDLRKQGRPSVELITDPQEYAKLIHNFDGLFDVILVDGINRNQCVAESISKLRQGGLLIIDNTDIQTDLVPLALSIASFSVERFSGYAPGILHPNETALLTKLA